MDIPIPGAEAYNAPGTDGRPYSIATDRAVHPIVCFFTVLFKIGAFLSYTFCGIVTDNFILTFVTVILLLAFDFWTIKNVSGRVLVGLRWWNEISPDGTSEWVFESKGSDYTSGRIDSLIFWSQLYLTPLVWAVLGTILSGFSPRWLILVAIAIIFSFTNLAGYWRCQKDASKNLKKYVVSKAVTTAMNNPDVLRSAASGMNNV